MFEAVSTVPSVTIRALAIPGRGLSFSQPPQRNSVGLLLAPSLLGKRSPPGDGRFGAGSPGWPPADIGMWPYRVAWLRYGSRRVVNSGPGGGPPRAAVLVWRLTSEAPAAAKETLWGRIARG